MKNSSLTFLCSALGLFSSDIQAQTTNSPADRTQIESEDFKVTERGAGHRVWERVTWATNQLGEVSGVTNSYTELATGLCWKNQQTGEWMDADPEIIIEPNGKGLGRKAQHSIRFEPNLNTSGAIDFTTPTGNRLRSHVIAIYFRDRKTDQSLQIAGLQDSIGTVVGKDQVIYENALTGRRNSRRCPLQIQKIGTKPGRNFPGISFSERPPTRRRKSGNRNLDRVFGFPASDETQSRRQGHWPC